MVLVLLQSQIAAIKQHAEQVYPEECCGLMVGTIDASNQTPIKSVLELAALGNEWTPELAEPDDRQHATKRRRYWIDPKDMLRVQKQAREANLDIIGVYHSHPDAAAVPSECDRAMAWPTYAYTIVSVCEGKAVDVQNWALDSEHQFQPEAIRLSPSSARDRMPISA